MADVGPLWNRVVKPSDHHPSIAVLPFANMSRDPDDEYFSDGLAEELINLLAHVPNLKVSARTSAFAFRGKEQDIRGSPKRSASARFSKAASAAREAGSA